MTCKETLHNNILMVHQNSLCDIINYGEIISWALNKYKYCTLDTIYLKMAVHKVC